MSNSENQEKKTYRCIMPGYDNVKLREPGEIFEYAGAPAHWMEELKASEAGEIEEAKATSEPKKSRRKPTGDTEVI